MYVRIDPRDFISPPFKPCPKCGQPEFGVLSIYGHGYSRRCRACWLTEKYPLPSITKRLIYLDQFVITNLMYAGTSNTPPVQKQLDPFWPDLFGTLNDLLNLQLVICPESAAHDRESIISRNYGPLKRTFEALSLGVKFHDFETIRRFQLVEHLRNWLAGDPDRPSAIDARRMLMHQNPHEWADRFIISVNLSPIPGYVEAIRQEREAVHGGLSEVFHRWKENPSVSWEAWFDEEALDYGPSVLKAYARDLARFAAVREGRLPVEELIFPTPSQVVVHSLLMRLRESGLAEEVVWPKLIEFLHSPTLKLVPFNRVSASLYACLARKAPHQKAPPKKGFFIDVDFISCLLPYCDAMFVDAECWSYLNELKRSGRLDYRARVFSLRSKEELLQYLNDIRASASSEHLEIARNLYG